MKPACLALFATHADHNRIRVEPASLKYNAWLAWEHVSL